MKGSDPQPRDSFDASTFESSLADVEEVLAASPVVLYSAAMHGERMIPLWVSRNVALVLGYHADDALAEGWWWRNVHPEDREQAMLSGAALLRHGHYAHEYRFRHANGAYIWMLDQIRTVKRGGADPTVVGSWTDVSASHRQQEQLEAAETHYRRLMQTSPYSIFTLDAAGRVLEVNEAGKRILGREELTGVSFIDLIAPADLPAADALFEQIMSGAAETFEIEICIVRPDGKTRLLSISAAPVRNDGVVGVHGIARDITEERAREERMRMLSAALDQLPDGVSVSDMDHCLLYANSAFLRMLGRDAEVSPDCDVFAASIGAGPVYAAMQQGLRAEGAWRGTFQHSIEGGAPVPLELSAAYVTVESEILTFSVLRDLSDELAREQQLRRAERLASVGTLVAGVAHELNNPLTAIAGFAELMLLESRPAEDQELLELTMREATRAAKIVYDLRLIARETQHAISSRSAVDLNDVVQHVVKLQRYTLETSNVELDVELSPDVTPVHGTASELEQVVLNLVVNAQQSLAHVATGPKRIVVSTSPSRNGTVLRIADTGPGIAAENLERVFDPFFTTKSPGEGMGLGLSLVHRIIMEHGGQVKVESPAGSGAVFTVSLPAAAGSETADASSAGETPALILSVLVVDDEEPIRRALVRYLGRQGHSVDTASDGRDALRLIERGSYDIILTDLRMPGMGGEALVDTLREQAPDIARRVMFMTGHVARDDAKLTADYGDVPVIEKPFSLGELGQRLHEFAERRSGRPGK